MPQMTFREQMAGFPVKQMLVVSVLRFSEPIAMTSLFPYLYFMIRDFQVAPTPEEIPKYSGYLASSFAFCQFLFAIQWGKMSNRLGRKPVLLCGLLGTAVSLVLFGFSTNYYMALFARSLAGVLNGNVAVLRTVIGELCVDKRHQALGFSTLPLLFNFGSVIGPLIGGSKLFTNPKANSPYDDTPGLTSVFKASSFADSYRKFRDLHPYAMSNIIVATFLVFSCVMGFLFLEETNDTFKERRDIGLDLGDALVRLICGTSPPHRPWHRTQRRYDEETPLLVDSTSSRGNSLPTRSSILSPPIETSPVSDSESIASLTSDSFNCATSDGPSSANNHFGSMDDVANHENGTSLSATSIPVEEEAVSSEEEAVSSDEEAVSSNEEVVSSDEEEVGPIGPYVSKSLSNAIVRRYSSTSRITKAEPSKLSRRVVTVIISNCIISLHSIAYNEFLPVFLAAQFHKRNLHFPFVIDGGFGLKTEYIGMLFSSTGIIGMVIILVIFPWIDRNLGTLAGFRLSLSFFPVVYFLVPLSIFTLHDYNSNIPSWVTAVVLYTLTSLKTLASATGMPQVMILNHRAAAKQHRAYVNSLTMSMLAFSRFIGPIVFGYLMTLGDKHHIAWLSWWLMASLALFGLLQSFCMEDYDD